MVLLGPPLYVTLAIIQAICTSHLSVSLPCSLPKRLFLFLSLILSLSPFICSAVRYEVLLEIRTLI